MHVTRYQDRGSVHWGVRQGDVVYSLASLPEGEPSWEQLANDSYQNSLRRAVEYEQLTTRPLEEVSLRAPVDQPSKVVSVGLNYYDHAEEQNEDPPDQPLLFSKAPSAIVGPRDSIVIPDAVEQVDYEVELAVIVGRSARYISSGDAHEYIAGYTVFNDVSARDAQFADGQFFRGKSYDTFAPMGPGLVVDGFDPNSADISLRVNDEMKQDSSTSEFIFSVGDLFEYITGVMTLSPGDVIATGTPGGVGIFRDPPDLLQSGDTISCHVEGIGTLENPVLDESL